MKNHSTVFVSGNFNVLHPGHLRLFKFAKDCGDKLIVAVNSDEIAGDGAIISEKMRLESVSSNTLVDEALILDVPLTDFLFKLKPDVVVKGKEYEGKKNIEESVLNSYGGKLIFSSGETIFSTAELLRKEFLNSSSSSISMPRDYLLRHGINASKLLSIIKSFASIKVCVLGDLIVDEYITCDALGMSQEDPVIVVTPRKSIKYIGGAGIVAGHAAGLGASVSLITVLGRDITSDFALDLLKKYSVHSIFEYDETRPTTLKQRFRSQNKTLLRVNHLHQEPISLELQEALFNKITEALFDADLLVFSDFNYGCLPQSFVERVQEFALSNNVMMVADSQSSSQIGDVGRFKGMTLLTPTEREARLSIRNYSDGLPFLVDKLMDVSQAKNIILKLGEDGALIHTSSKSDLAWVTDRLEALNSMPRDVAGAGDSMLIASSLSLAAGSDIWMAACIGSLVAGIQVGRIGNLPISCEELLELIKQ